MSRFVRRVICSVISLAIACSAIVGWATPTQAQDYKRVPLIGADFSGQDLTEADFTQAKLPKSNFSNANLQNVSLFGASLEDSNLEGANLLGTDLNQGSDA